MSLNESKKLARANRYILVFTVVTIFYLPLNFITVSIFKKKFVSPNLSSSPTTIDCPVFESKTNIIFEDTLHAGTLRLE